MVVSIMAKRGPKEGELVEIDLSGTRSWVAHNLDGSAVECMDSLGGIRLAAPEGVWQSFFEEVMSLARQRNIIVLDERKPSDGK